MNISLTGIFIYYFITNVVAIILAIRDYVSFVNHRDKNRVSDPVLLIVGVLSGGLGMLIVLWSTRYKLKDKRYIIGLPVAFILEMILLIILY